MGGGGGGRVGHAIRADGRSDEHETLHGSMCYSYGSNTRLFLQAHRVTTGPSKRAALSVHGNTR